MYSSVKSRSKAISLPNTSRCLPLSFWSLWPCWAPPWPWWSTPILKMNAPICWKRMCKAYPVPSVPRWSCRTLTVATAWKKSWCANPCILFPTLSTQMYSSVMWRVILFCVRSGPIPPRILGSLPPAPCTTAIPSVPHCCNGCTRPVP